MISKLLRPKIARVALRNDSIDKNITRIDLPIKRLDTAKRTGFKKGDKPDYASNDIFVYPKDYQTWNFNYKSSAMMWGMFALGVYVLVQYNYDYHLRTGYEKRPNRPAFKP